MSTLHSSFVIQLVRTLYFNISIQLTMTPQNMFFPLRAERLWGKAFLTKFIFL